MKKADKKKEIRRTTGKPREENIAGKRITVMGLGRFGGGVGATRWLVNNGAHVTVSDIAPAEKLANSIAALDGLDIEFHLGGHDEKDFTGCDLLVVNPAIPFNSPFLQIAQKAGVKITTEINLFISRCRGEIIGVTGSAGKSTTVSMISAILSSHAPTHLGGNIGVSLLDELDSIEPDHLVVLELSSFQLSYLPLIRKSPRIAVITNLHPNHLDRHGNMANYAEAKKNIFRFQGPDDVLILNRDDPEVACWADEAFGTVETFSPDDEPFELKIPGRHNQANAQAAWHVAKHFGIERETVAKTLADFTGLAHRLELITQYKGIRIYNDSKATTPQETIAALEAFPARKIVAIVGGYDKKIDLPPLHKALVERAKAVITIGQTGESIAKGVETIKAGSHFPIVVRAHQLPAAVNAAVGLCQPGDNLLLSPACASYDMFENYQQRGKIFVDLIRSIVPCR